MHEPPARWQTQLPPLQFEKPQHSEPLMQVTGVWSVVSAGKRQQLRIPDG